MSIRNGNCVQGAGHVADDNNDQMFMEISDGQSTTFGRNGDHANGHNSAAVRRNGDILQLKVIDPESSKLYETEETNERSRLGRNSVGDESDQICGNQLERSIKVPDGGWGWVIVASSFMITSIVGGAFLGFSIMYAEFVQLFGTTVAVAGWVGSIYMASGNVFGIFFGAFIENCGSRVVCIVGAVLACFGFVISAFATSIVELYIFFGIVSGSGVGMMMMSSIVLVNQYFDRNRAIANSLGLLGFSVGGFIAGPLVRLLLDTYSLRGTILIIAGIFLQVAVLGSLYRPLRLDVRSHKKAQKKNAEKGKSKHEENALAVEVNSEKCNSSVIIVGESEVNELLQKNCTAADVKDCEKSSSLSSLRKVPVSCWRQICQLFSSLFDFSLLRRIPFLLYVITTFCLHVGLTTFFQHTPNRAIWLGVEPHLVALLPTLASAATGVVRLISGFIANLPCVDRVLQVGIGISLSGAVQIATMLATTFEMMAVINVFEGILNGVYFSVVSTVLVDLTGIENIARSMSIWSLAIGVGTLLSVPFSGFLFDVTNNYDIPFLVTGTLQFFGGLLTVAASWLIRRRRNC